MSNNKVITTITIDKDVKVQAREVGLNISKIAENALRVALKQLEPIMSQPQRSHVGE